MRNVLDTHHVLEINRKQDIRLPTTTFLLEVSHEILWQKFRPQQIRSVLQNKSVPCPKDPWDERYIYRSMNG